MKYAVPVIVKKPFLHFFQREHSILVYLVKAKSADQASDIAYEVFERACNMEKIRGDWSYNIMAAKELLNLTDLNVATPYTMQESVRDTLEFVYGNCECGDPIRSDGGVEAPFTKELCPKYNEPILPDENGNCSLCGEVENH